MGQLARTSIVPMPEANAAEDMTERSEGVAERWQRKSAMDVWAPYGGCNARR